MFSDQRYDGFSVGDPGIPENNKNLEYRNHIMIPKGYSFQTINSKINLVGKNDELYQIPGEIDGDFGDFGIELKIEEKTFGFEKIVLSEDSGFLAIVTSSYSSEYPIFALLENKNCKWKSFGRIGPPELDNNWVISGRGLHFTEIVVSEDNVLVFGYVNRFLYLNSFDKSTGQLNIRFSTFDWRGVD